MDASSNGSLPKPVRGRPFAPGNRGRPRGSRNRSTIVTQVSLEGEAEKLLRKGFELANAGDPTMLKFFLERLVPRDRKIRVALPELETPEDAIEALAVVTHAVADGQITPGEGAQLSTLIKSFSQAIDVAELARRVDALEAMARRGPQR